MVQRSLSLSPEVKKARVEVAAKKGEHEGEKERKGEGEKKVEAEDVKDETARDKKPKKKPMDPQRNEKLFKAGFKSC